MFEIALSSSGIFGWLKKDFDCQNIRMFGTTRLLAMTMSMFLIFV